jgi:hypothetical protein
VALSQALIMRTKRLTLFVKLNSSVAEPHHFYAAPASGKNVNAAVAPTLVYSKAKNFKFKHTLKLYFSFDSVRFL